MPKPNHIAKLVIHGLPDMTAAERKRLSTWLRCYAISIAAGLDDYAKVATFRLMPRGDKDAK